LSCRTAGGYWEGRLSSSALSTATAVMAFKMLTQARLDSASTHDDSYRDLADRGVRWLAAHQNVDGGWGDTPDSLSNISTTALGWAALAGHECEPAYQFVADRAASWLSRAAGDLEPNTLARAIANRYGRDRTFSAPILSSLALTGRLGGADAGWRVVPQLPFELAVLPPQVFGWLHLPVVSYALPALIAIGQLEHHFRSTNNPLVREIREWARPRTMRLLDEIQPSSGGFLQATPLTSFVVASLAAIGQADHAVTRRGAAFLAASGREDGSWPIDTNLATWVTTLSVYALCACTDPGLRVIAEREREALVEWLLAQQHVEEHPYTHAKPGGWAWTDLPGGVPDADDTAGALLALRHLSRAGGSVQRLRPLPSAHGGAPSAAAALGCRGGVPSAAAALGCYARGSGEWGWGPTSSDESPGCGMSPLPLESGTTRTALGTPQAAARESGSVGDGRTLDAVRAGVDWLLQLQNRDGGIPTFCRGWGYLPFDRSAPDLTAHALRAWMAWRDMCPGRTGTINRAIGRALRYLSRAQRMDGAWVPLWFGNQGVPGEGNPTYGTSRVMLTLCALDDGGVPLPSGMLDRAARWLMAAQNLDGGWGGAPGVAFRVGTLRS